MLATAHTSTPMPTIMADSTLARAAGVAGGGIAGRRLELGERLAAFREKIALVDGVLDEIPGQQSVQRVRAVDEAVGVDTVRPAAERFQDGPPLVGTLVQADEDRRRTPVAAREERLQVCLARALGLDLDGGDGAQCAAEVGELPAQRGDRLHRLPLERRPRLRHEGVDRDQDAADAPPPAATSWQSAATPGRLAISAPTSPIVSRSARPRAIDARSVSGLR